MIKAHCTVRHCIDIFIIFCLVFSLFSFHLSTAISEECSDELLGNSATSSPPNGFMAPLKKRRVVRQCSDLNAEDVPSPKEDIKELVTEEGK